MYTRILKELRKQETLKAVYIVLRQYKRQYALTYNQVEYLLYQYTDKG